MYEIARSSVAENPAWNEGPFYAEGESLYRCVGAIAERMGKELRISSFQEKISGRSDAVGSWSVQFGVWEEVIAWGLCETESGFRGLMIAGEEDKDVIFSLLKEVKSLTDSDFTDLLQNCWGSFRDVPQNEATPGYENHLPSAQNIYQALPRKIVQQESTFADGDGKEMHIEIGTTKALLYLYWANTFDQRQILLMDEQGGEMLREYYQESLQVARDASGEASSSS